MSKENETALEQAARMLDRERTCHDDCMCDICIAKQQIWEGQEEQKRLESELAEIKDWAKCEEVGCGNSLLEVGVCLECWNKVVKQLAAYRWIPVERELPKESGLYQALRAINRLPTTREYSAKSLMWFSHDMVTHWKKIILPEDEA